LEDVNKRKGRCEEEVVKGIDGELGRRYREGGRER
jgi:hypothetical protein